MLINILLHLHLNFIAIFLKKITLVLVQFEFQSQTPAYPKINF